MKIDVIIPHINKPALLEKCLGLYRDNCNPDITNVIVIDNGSEPPLENNIYGSVVRYPDNLGMIKTLEEAKKMSTAEILCYTHSDTFYYEPGWDAKVVEAFQADPKLGLIGIVGGTQATADGGRSNMYCSFRNGHMHGNQTPPGLHYVALLDGCSLIFRREALDSFEIDKGFYPHHFYDKDWCLEVLTRGWKVAVMAMDCEHLGGQITIGGQHYQKWANHFLEENKIDTHQNGDQYFYTENEKRYINKWKDKFPISVNKDGTYTSR